MLRKDFSSFLHLSYLSIFCNNRVKTIFMSKIAFIIDIVKLTYYIKKKGSGY